MLERLDVLDERWCRPLAPEQLADAARGPPRRAPRPARQVPRASSSPTTSSCMLHLRMTGTLLLDPARPPPHTRVRFGSRRRPRAAASSTRGGSVRASSRSATTRATRSSPPASGSSRSTTAFTAPHLRALARGRARAGQGVPARPEADRRRRQHLRRRGAVPRAHPPAAAGGHAQAAAAGRAARTRWSRHWRPGSPPRARRSTTSATPTACRAPSRTSSSCTCARASRAPSAARASSSCARRAGDLRLPALPAARRVRPRRRTIREPAPARSARDELLDSRRSTSPSMTTWGNVIMPVTLRQLRAALGVLGEVDLLVRDLAGGQQGLGGAAETAGLSGVHGDATHYFT